MRRVVVSITYQEEAEVELTFESEEDKGQWAWIQSQLQDNGFAEAEITDDESDAQPKYECFIKKCPPREFQSDIDND